MSLGYLTSRRHYSSAQTIHPPVITFFPIHSFVLLPEAAGGGGAGVLIRAEHSAVTHPQHFSCHLLSNSHQITETKAARPV